MLTESFEWLRDSTVISAEEQLSKKKMIKKLFWIDFTVCFLFFAPFIKLHFSIDSYTMMILQDNVEGVRVHLTNGRFIAALIIKTVNLLGINVVLDTALAVFTFMFCSAWCMAKITEWLFDGKVEEKNWLKIAVIQMGSMVGFCNVFIAEWYQFTEVLFIYAAAIIFGMYAAYFLKENRKIMSFVFLAISYNCYQSAIALYVFLILFFILKKYQFRFQIQAVKEVITGVFECTGVFAANFLMTKLSIIMGIIPNNSRYNDIGIKNIINNVLLLFQNQKLVWIDANGMMPVPLMALMIGIIIFLAGLTFMQKETHKIKDACYVVVMLTSGIFVVFLPIVIVAFFWMAPWSIVSIFFFYTVLSFYIAFQADKKVQVVAICCLGILLSGMMYFTHVYARDIQYSNDKDEWYINMLQEKIEEYERQNNIKIEYLGFAADANICWRWDVSGNYSWDVLERIMAVEWAKIDAIRYYKGKKYEQIEVPEEYAQYFMQNDWNSPDMETQVRFDGNKCYIAVF